MTEALVLGGIVLVVLAVLARRFVPPLFYKTPEGRHLGPYVKGESRTVGTELIGNGFAFPQAPGHVNALVEPCGPLKGKSKIVFRWRVTGDKFHAQDKPAERGEIRLLIQRKGDDYSAKGAKAWYRLYAPSPQFLVAGEHEMVVGLSPQGWIGVHGEEPNQAQLDDILANTAAIHVCFGGGGGSAHGAFATGPATFELLELTAT